MMLHLHARPSTRPWSSIRFASHLSQNPTDGRPVKTTAATAAISQSGYKSSSILSRLSDKTQTRIRRNSDTELKSPIAQVEDPAAVHGKPRPRATSFISARFAQQRDHAAEKWFTDVRELDIDDAGQSNDIKLLPRKKHPVPKRHEMRPRTDLNSLFAPPIASSLRVQTKRELGGDYTRYLPDGYPDPHRLPIDYARLVLGRNKHISLNAQTGALNIIQEAIRGRTNSQYRSI